MDVKCFNFETYCSNLYHAHMYMIVPKRRWKNWKLHITCYNSLQRFMFLPWSKSKCLINLGIYYFDEILTIFAFSFRLPTFACLFLFYLKEHYFIFQFHKVTTNVCALNWSVLGGGGDAITKKWPNLMNHAYISALSFGGCMAASTLCILSTQLTVLLNEINSIVEPLDPLKSVVNNV